MRKILSAAAALGLAAAACSSGPTYEEADLMAIVLQPDEAPETMQLVESESGSFVIEDVTSDETQLTLYAEEGFVSAYDSIFATPGLAGVPGDAIGRAAMIVDSSAYVYESLEGAETSFARLDLGDEAFALRVELSRQGLGLNVGVLYSWRVDNMIMRVVVFGNDSVEVDDVRPLADVMQQHAVTS